MAELRGGIAGTVPMANSPHDKLSMASPDYYLRSFLYCQIAANDDFLYTKNNKQTSGRDFPAELIFHQLKKRKHMNTVLILCDTLQEELNMAMRRTGVSIPVLHIESGLHNVPKKLNKVLQQTIDEAEKQGAERILFVMGFCGNSTQGLHADHAEMIIPRVDDCITLLLGSLARRKELQEGGGTYFMTKGWISGERNIYKEYEYMMEKYGEETGQELFDMMFGNYVRIGILDTGAYEMEPVQKETERMANALHLRWEIFDASVDYIEELLRGPWPPERFLTVAPGTEIKPRDLWVK